MKKGFYTIMLAQFFSSLADNALFVAAVALLHAQGFVTQHSQRVNGRLGLLLKLAA